MLRKNSSIKKRMQNKGFTLLEVLAVIIVLAVIALITIPIVTSAMKDAKKNSFKTSMTNLVKAADNYYADRQLEIDKVMTFCFGLTGSNCTTEKLNFSGKEPSAGKLIINPDGEISLVDITNGTYYANYNSDSDDEVTITEDNEVLTRDELTQALKDLQQKLIDTEKKLTNKDNQQQIQIDSNTKIANTANNTANSINTGMLNKTYPVGSIYISYSSTNPSSLFGGTWVAYGTGRTLVGVNTGDSNFNTVGKTGGTSSFNNSHTHTINAHNHTTGSVALTIAQMPAHGAHLYPNNNWLGHGNTGHYLSTGVAPLAGGIRGWNLANGNELYPDGINLGSGQAHNHGATGTTSLTTNASQGTQSLLQPYITVYMWRRTA